MMLRSLLVAALLTSIAVDAHGDESSRFVFRYPSAAAHGAPETPPSAEPEELDTAPDPFDFGVATGLEPSQSPAANPVYIDVLSPLVTLSGFDGVMPISFAMPGSPNARLFVNGDYMPGATGTVKAGDVISLVSQTPALIAPDPSPASYIGVVTVGAVSGTWAISTRPAKWTVDPFSFAPVTDVPGRTRGGQSRFGGWDAGYYLTLRGTCSDASATFTVSQDQAGGSWTAPMPSGSSFQVLEGWRVKFSAKTPASGTTTTCTASFSAPAVGAVSASWTLTGQ